MYIRFVGHVCPIEENYHTKGELTFAFSSDPIELGCSQVLIDIMAYDEQDSEVGKIGEIELYSFNANHLGLDMFANNFDDFDPEGDLLEIMDNQSQEMYQYYNILSQYFMDAKASFPDEAALEDCIEILDSDLSFVVLQRFFINPDWRKKGIGSFIMKNFSKIVYSSSHVDPVLVVGIINPDDRTDETKSVQKKLFKDAGYLVDKDDVGNDVFAGYTWDWDV